VIDSIVIETVFILTVFILMIFIDNIHLVETVFILRFIDIYRYIFSGFISEYCLYEISITSFYIKNNNRG